MQCDCKTSQADRASRGAAVCVARAKGRYIARQSPAGEAGADPLDINGRLVAAAGEPVQKLMRLTLVRDNGDIEEAAESKGSDEAEDLPEEGLREADLRRDSSEEMKQEIGTMLEQATQMDSR